MESGNYAPQKRKREERKRGTKEKRGMRMGKVAIMPCGRGKEKREKGKSRRSRAWKHEKGQVCPAGRGKL